MERRPYFTEPVHAKTAIDQFLQTAADYSFEGIAYCFMPDHMHGLLEATAVEANFAKFASMFKQRSVFDFKKRTGKRLWQESFFDRVLREEDATLDVAAYIILNPVRAGLCKHPSEYPYLGTSRYSIAELLEAAAWRP